MSVQSITGAQLRDMVCVASAYLEKNKKAIDALNVFPVPDGDTGINMSLTLQSAAKEVQQNSSESVADVAADMAMGSLRGARGNSGVILSQIFRGFSKGLAGEQVLTAQSWANALERGVESAYKAVMKPKEGTMLTVSRAMAEAARGLSEEGASVYEALEKTIAAGELMLAQTPDMLPVLKEAGVVDSGGMGLIVIFQGFKMALDGEEVPEVATLDFGRANVAMIEDDEGIEYGYCTEFMIKNEETVVSETDIIRLRGILSTMGDCVLVVGDGSLVKVHVHTNEPGTALQHGLAMGGMLSGIKVDNMHEEHKHVMKEAEELVGIHEAAKTAKKLKEDAEQPRKEHAMVAVAAGEGISQIFRDLGVDAIVEGGQSMNPSTEDILDAIDKAPSQNVYIFPNNKNIIMAAKQAAEVTDKNVYVLESTSVPQGISAAIVYSPNLSFNENADAMNEAIEEVDTGVITYAVRNTTLNGKGIEEGDILGMVNGELTESGKNIPDVTKNVLRDMVNDDKETISLFYGLDVPEQEAETLADELQREYEMCDVQVYAGGQPLYYYILSVE